MRGIPISEIYRGIKCHGIIYCDLVNYRGILSDGIDDQYTFYQTHIYLASHNIFVTNRLKYGKTCIDTCLSSNDNLYHCIIGSPLSKNTEKRNNYKSNFFIYQEIRLYTGITVFFWQYVIIAISWYRASLSKLAAGSRQTCGEPAASFFVIGQWENIRSRLATCSSNGIKKERKEEERKCNDLKCVRKPTKSRLSLTHHANKSSRWAE